MSAARWVSAGCASGQMKVTWAVAGVTDGNVRGCRPRDDGSSASAVSMISDLFPREKTPRAFAFYNFCIQGGDALANVVGGLLLGFFAAMGAITVPLLGTLHSWHMVFIVFGAPGVLWFPLVPILAMLIAGRPTGIAWTAIHVLALVAFYVLDRAGDVPVLGLAPDTVAFLHMALGASATIVAFLLASLFESLKVDALGHLEAANRALALARDQAEAAARAKSDFLATMSHEIRTPMNGVMGTIALLLETGLTAEQRAYVETAQRCGQDLLGIVNDILDISRIESGMLRIEAVPFRLDEVVLGVLDLFAATAVEKGIGLSAAIDPAVPGTVKGDPLRLRQVLLNLIDNAVKFTAIGGVTVRITNERATEGALVLRIAVSDTGIGIPASVQKSLFVRFAQADPSISRRFGGSGLGLTICRQLVTLMGGELGLESEAGRGATFSFTLPVAPVEGTGPAPARRHPQGRCGTAHPAIAGRSAENARRCRRRRWRRGWHR